MIPTTTPTETAAPAAQAPSQPTTKPACSGHGGDQPAVRRYHHTHYPATDREQLQAVIATRLDTAGKFALTLGGVQIGWLSAAGGEAFGQVVTERVGPDNIALKHLAGVAYEPITLVTDFQSKALMNWIAESWNGKYSRQSGSILDADYDGNIRGEREFFNALIAETTLPALDASAKESAHITVKLAPEYTRLKAGSGAKVASSTVKTTVRWLPSYFRFEMAASMAARSTRSTRSPFVKRSPRAR